MRPGIIAFADGGGNPLFRQGKPLPKELLKLLYGSHERYRDLIMKNVAETVSRGFLLPDDRDAFIERVVNTA